MASFVALWAVTHLTGTGQEIDAGAFRTVAPVHDAAAGAAGAVRRGLPLVGAFVVAVLTVLAVARRRWRTVAAAALVASGTVVVSLTARDLFVRPDLGGFGYEQVTFPSGHVAVVGGLCAATWLLWPAASSRAVVALVGAGTASVAAVASVVTYAHRPSDVLGSMLLTAVVALVVCWTLRTTSDQTRTSAASYSSS